MRKRRQGRTLSRNATQRRALKRTMLVSLINSGSIKTTLAKAKELRPFIERIITRAKKVEVNNKASVVTAMRRLKKDISMDTAKKLIELAKKYKTRNGGYLRIIKLAPRKSDVAEMAIIELVGNEGKVIDNINNTKSVGKNIIKKVKDGKKSEKKKGNKKVKKISK